jgi:hypothetical protein
MEPEKNRKRWEAIVIKWKESGKPQNGFKIGLLKEAKDFSSSFFRFFVLFSILHITAAKSGGVSSSI